MQLKIQVKRGAKDNLNHFILKHILWELGGIASLRQFHRVPTKYDKCIDTKSEKKDFNGC